MKAWHICTALARQAALRAQVSARRLNQHNCILPRLPSPSRFAHGRLETTHLSIKNMSDCDWQEAVFLEEFTDHAGQRAFRYGARSPYHESHDDEIPSNQAWPPEDFFSYFYFQVYITMDFELDKQKCSTLAAHCINMHDVDAKIPLWEFYTGPRAVLDCVDHSRHEIAHRKNSAKDVPRIYPLQRNFYDHRLLAFAFIIDNERAWHIPLEGAQLRDDVHFPDHDGPIWAHFDPRLPSAVAKIDEALLLKSDVREELVEFVDQIDVEILRIQGGEAEGDMMNMYRETMYDVQDKTGNDDDDIAPEMSDSSLVGTDQAAPEGTSQFEIIEHTGITISNTKGKSDLQYVIYTTFSCSLEHIARQFAAAVSENTPKTFRLDFYAAKSDADALTKFSETLPETSAQYDIPSSVEKPRAGTRTYYQEPFTPDNPFKACSLLIDRPDFLNVPAVRFLLSVGWPQDHQENDYMETACVRSSDMQAVVKRMVLESNNPN